MRYFDAYKKRLKGSNMSKSIELDTDDNITREFQESPAYRQAYLIDKDFNESLLDVRMVNVDKSVFSKNFYLLPKTKLEVGQYIRIEEEYFLIYEFEYNSSSPYAKTKYCNQVINFTDGNIIPCVAEGESYGVKMTATNDVILETDTKVKLTIGNTELGRTIHPDFRVIFGNSAQGIYRVGDITVFKTGVIMLTCKKDKFMEGLDDLTNNIAWQPFHDYEEKINNTRSIKGDKEMIIGIEYEYSLNTKEICDFAVDNPNVKIINLSSNGIVISCDKAGEIFKIKAFIKDTLVAEKTIITTN